MSLCRPTVSANTSRRTRIGREPCRPAASSNPRACSTRSADHGAPLTPRRISTYSSGFAIASSSAVAISHTNSSKSRWLDRTKRARQSGRRRRDRPRPQLGERALDDRLGDDGAIGLADRDELAQPRDARLRPVDVAAALVAGAEVVVEVEEPDVPLGQQLELGGRRVGVTERGELRIVGGVEGRLVPDGIRVEHPGVPRPRPRPGTRRVEVRVAARSPRHVEVRD